MRWAGPLKWAWAVVKLGKSCEEEGASRGPAVACMQQPWCTARWLQIHCTARKCFLRVCPASRLAHSWGLLCRPVHSHSPPLLWPAREGAALPLLSARSWLVADVERQLEEKKPRLLGVLQEMRDFSLKVCGGMG